MKKKLPVFEPKIKIIVLTFLIVICFCGGLIWYGLSEGEYINVDRSSALIPAGTSAEVSVAKLEENFALFSAAAGKVDSSWQAELAANAEISAQLAELASSVAANKNLSDEAYEKNIVERLGKAIYTADGPNSKIMIFELKKEDFRGYMAKITLKTQKSLRVTISPSSKPGGETPSQAAKRKGAIFAVNGGGFASATSKGVTYRVPLGNAMIEGKLQAPFVASWNDLAFAGFTKNNKLTSGIYNTEAELKSSGVWQGVSFVPILIQNWEVQRIPSKWASARQPRTVLGQYPNGDIIFIVVDGRQSNWSNGITLEEMQVLLVNLKVMEAFNLDGGGSSAMYYNGKILNKPSDGTERKMATNFVVFK